MLLGSLFFGHETGETYEGGEEGKVEKWQCYTQLLLLENKKKPSAPLINLWK